MRLIIIAAAALVIAARVSTATSAETSTNTETNTTTHSTTKTIKPGTHLQIHQLPAKTTTQKGKVVHRRDPNGFGCNVGATQGKAENPTAEWGCEQGGGDGTGTSSSAGSGDNSPSGTGWGTSSSGDSSASSSSNSSSSSSGNTGLPTHPTGKCNVQCAHTHGASSAAYKACVKKCEM